MTCTYVVEDLTGSRVEVPSTPEAMIALLEARKRTGGGGIYIKNEAGHLQLACYDGTPPPSVKPYYGQREASNEVAP